MSSGNPYTITASGAVDSDYSISYVGGTLTVTAAGLTITANNQTKVYGAALPTLTASYSGFVNGDTSANLTTQPTLTTTATAGSHVSGSPYTITASGAVRCRLHDQRMSREASPSPPAPLTITATNKTKVYGAALPTLTASLTRASSMATPRPASPPSRRTQHYSRGHQPCLGQPLHHHRQWRGRIRDYSIAYVAGTPDRHHCGTDDHRRATRPRPTVRRCRR